MRGLKRDRSARVIIAGHAFVHVTAATRREQDHLAWAGGLAAASTRIDISVLAQFDEFRRFRQGQSTTVDDGRGARKPEPAGAVETPEEALETAYLEAQATLAKEMLTRLTQQDATVFEQVVLDVLLAIGYGGSRRDAARRLGRSGDGGLDGVIYEDRLGMDLIYVQAKRWTDKTVGRPEIQAFVGALEVTKASKGVFITTARFSKEAESYVERLRQRVVLTTASNWPIS